jgi:hypothetical protein
MSAKPEHSEVARATSPTGASQAVDRALKKNEAAAGYDSDAMEIARVLVRHYGDEAEAVVDRLSSCLVHARSRSRGGKRT